MSGTLQLSSDKIVFKADPSDKQALFRLTMKNTSSGRKAFKVKTNNRDRYLVAPASGLVEEGGQVDVDFTFYALDLQGKPSVENDKFCILVCRVADDRLTREGVDDFLRANEASVVKQHLTVRFEDSAASATARPKLSQVVSSSTKTLDKPASELSKDPIGSSVRTAETEVPISVADEIRKLRVTNQTLEESSKKLSVC